MAERNTLLQKPLQAVLHSLHFFTCWRSPLPAVKDTPVHGSEVLWVLGTPVASGVGQAGLKNLISMLPDAGGCTAILELDDKVCSQGLCIRH